MSVAEKTKSKRKLAEYERIRDLDAQAKTWAEEREEPVTAVTWRAMANEASECALCGKPISLLRDDCRTVAGSRYKPVTQYVHAACAERKDLEWPR